MLVRGQFAGQVVVAGATGLDDRVADRGPHAQHGGICEGPTQVTDEAGLRKPVAHPALLGRIESRKRPIVHAFLPTPAVLLDEGTSSSLHASRHVRDGPGVTDASHRSGVPSPCITGPAVPCLSTPVGTTPRPRPPRRTPRTSRTPGHCRRWR